MRNIAIRLINLVCVFVFVRTRADLWKYTLIMTLGTACSQGYLWFYVKKIAGWYLPRIKDLKKHLIPELVLFIPIIAVSLYTMMDKVMLGQISTMTQVGYYEGAGRILNIPMGVITALGTVMLPRMSNLAAKGKTRESGEYIYNSMIFAMFLASGMMFGIAGIAEDFVPLFLGREYSPCILLIRTMAPTVPFIAWANVIRTQYLIPNHEDKSYIISVTLGAAVNLAVNTLLIPHIHALGAVIGTVFAEGSVCISQTIMVRRKIEIYRYIKDTVMYFIFGGIMLLLISMVHNFFQNVFLALVLEIFIGGTAYTAMSAIYFGLSHREVMKKAFKKLRKK